MIGVKIIDCQRLIYAMIDLIWFCGFIIQIWYRGYIYTRYRCQTWSCSYLQAGFSNIQSQLKMLAITLVFNNEGQRMVPRITTTSPSPRKTIKYNPPILDEMAKNWAQLSQKETSHSAQCTLVQNETILIRKYCYESMTIAHKLSMFCKCGQMLSFWTKVQWSERVTRLYVNLRDEFSNAYGCMHDRRRRFLQFLKLF